MIVSPPPSPRNRANRFSPPPMWQRDMPRGVAPPRDVLHRFLCPHEPPEREQRLIWIWGASLALRSGLSAWPVGPWEELTGESLEELQRRTNAAFVPPVVRVRLTEPLLAYRFYGDLCRQVTHLYASMFTVMRVPGFGDYAKNLLGLTGRNSANNLAAVRIETGSQIVVGGISNRVEWADQILVERNGGMTPLDNLARYTLPS